MSAPLMRYDMTTASSSSAVSSTTSSVRRRPGTSSPAGGSWRRSGSGKAPTDEPCLRDCPSDMAEGQSLGRVFFAVAGRLVVLRAFELVRQVVDVEPCRIGVRVDVTLPVPELAPVPARVAQRLRRTDVALHLDILRRALQRRVAGVRLRGQREVDRGLCEIQAR